MQRPLVTMTALVFTALSTLSTTLPAQAADPVKIGFVKGRTCSGDVHFAGSILEYCIVENEGCIRGIPSSRLAES